MSDARLLFHRLLVQEEGQSMIEYGIVLSLIGIVCVSSVTAVGSKAQALLEGCRDAILAAI